ncbi:MAG TPA: ribonuclease HI family protein [Caldisericia bacterium]|nr:ribonuclease HI family protein [Caldisericia bacterium]
MYNVYTDGASRGNPGPSSCAFVIYQDKSILMERAEFLGIGTNNQAEYMGIIRALETLTEMKAYDIVVFSDSELVVKQLNKAYQVKSQQLKILYHQAQSLIPGLFPIQFQHIPRSQNSKADELCNKVLNQQA